MTSPPVANLAVLRELGRPGVRRPGGALGALHWPTPILLKTTSILAPAETHTPAPADGRDGDGRGGDGGHDGGRGRGCSGAVMQRITYEELQRCIEHVLSETGYYSSMRPIGDVYLDFATLGELELDGGNDAISPKTPDAPMLGGGGRAAGAAAGGGAPYRELPSASSLRQRTSPFPRPLPVQRRQQQQLKR